MNQFTQNILAKAKANPKKIILADGNDPRVIQAASILTSQKIANITIIAYPEEVKNMASNLNLDLSQTEIIDPNNNEYSEKLIQDLYELRKEKGLTLEKAGELLKSPLYFGTMLVKTGMADGLVGGANCPTADVLRPALQIIKTAPNNNIVSSFFAIISPNTQYGENGVLFFADCGLNVNPNDTELANIATQTADSFKFLTDCEPKVAMLSFSTNGSGSGESVDKVKNATLLVKDLRPELLIEGELQADAALVPHVGAQKHPDGKLKGDANILVFPDLNSGNIGYKLVQRLGNAEAFGPITQGLNKPINDLSRGCNVDDIVATVAITSIQASAPVSG